jgi:hypothetical protein
MKLPKGYEEYYMAKMRPPEYECFSENFAVYCKGIEAGMDRSIMRRVHPEMRKLIRSLTR